nr:MAG TPA: hypothetical protein [Caudoviricetes sp.]
MVVGICQKLIILTTIFYWSYLTKNQPLKKRNNHHSVSLEQYYHHKT